MELHEPPVLSVVMPVFNEAGSLREMYQQLRHVLDGAVESYELVFVDDGSRDGSLDTLLQLREADQRVKIVELSRNFGHQAALSAGIEAAEGEAIITMDADLQHPPELIPELLDVWRQGGADIVSTSRRSTPDVSLWKKTTSRFFYGVMNALSDVEVRPGAADFRLIDRRAADVLTRLGEKAVFLRGLTSWIGFRQTFVEYDAAPRFAGESKFSSVKMMRFAVDGITSFSSIPLYASIYIGFAVSLAAFVYGLFAVYARLFTRSTIEGWTSVIAVLLFLGGMHMILSGIQGAYIARIYNEVKQRPRYVVRARHGL